MGWNALERSSSGQVVNENNVYRVIPYVSYVYLETLHTNDVIKNNFHIEKPKLKIYVYTNLIYLLLV